MAESLDAIRARIMPRLVIPKEAARWSPAADQLHSVPDMLVIDDVDSGKTVVTVGIEVTEREAAGYTADDFLVKLSGNLVGAGINRNGAAWEKADLQFGLPSVPHGPLNWLHDDRKIIGCLTDARMAEQDSVVQADSVVWGWLYREEAAMVEDVALQKRLYYSMECISNSIQCVGENGCGREMAYVDTLARNERCCDHIRERSAGRRFVNPIFQGAAVIVPPKVPGWANAHLGLMKEAERVMPEAAEFVNGDAELAAQILQFIRPKAA